MSSVIKYKISSTIKKGIINIVIMLSTLSRNFYYYVIYLLVTKRYLNFILMLSCIFCIRLFFYKTIYADEFDELLKYRMSKSGQTFLEEKETYGRMSKSGQIFLEAKCTEDLCGTLKLKSMPTVVPDTAELLKETAKPSLPAKPLPKGPLMSKRDYAEIMRVGQQAAVPAKPLPEGPLLANKDSLPLCDIVQQQYCKMPSIKNIPIVVVVTPHKDIILLSQYLETTFIRLDTLVILKEKEHAKIAEGFFRIIDERIPKEIWTTLLEASNNNKATFIKLTLQMADNCVEANNKHLEQLGIYSDTLVKTNKYFRLALLSYGDKIFTKSEDTKEYLFKLTTKFRTLN